MRRVVVLSVVAASATVMIVAVAVASTMVSGEQSPKPTYTTKWRKLSSVLVDVLEAEQQSGRGLAVARKAGLQVRGPRIVVVVETRGERAEAMRAIVTGGGVVVALHANLVQALVRPLALGALTRPAAVAFVRAPRSPVTTLQPAIVPTP